MVKNGVKEYKVFDRNLDTEKKSYINYKYILLDNEDNEDESLKEYEDESLKEYEYNGKIKNDLGQEMRLYKNDKVTSPEKHTHGGAYIVKSVGQIV
jgi:hypothetical protein